MSSERTHSAGLSDVGKVRPSNEDQFLVAEMNRSMTIHASSLPVEAETEFYSAMTGHLLVVADGISGGPGGLVASQIGVGTVARYVLNAMPWFLSLNHDHDDDQQEELLATMLEVESAVEAQADATPEFEGMGTTLTMAYVIWPRLYVVNIGDSRCYLLRDQKLEQLTHDQTAAQGLVDQGTMTAEQASRSPLSNILLSSIGQGLGSFHPDVYKAELQAGDRILVCTDGLTSQVDDADITRLLVDSPSPEQACADLVDAANGAGGRDNVTVVVSECYPPPKQTEYTPS